MQKSDHSDIFGNFGPFFQFSIFPKLKRRHDTGREVCRNVVMSVAMLWTSSQRRELRRDVVNFVATSWCSSQRRDIRRDVMIFVATSWFVSWCHDLMMRAVGREVDPDVMTLVATSWHYHISRDGETLQGLEVLALAATSRRVLRKVEKFGRDVATKCQFDKRLERL